jgi:hypothetical protein
MIRLGNIIDLSIRLRKEKGGWAFGPGVGDGDTSESVPDEPFKARSLKLWPTGGPRADRPLYERKTPLKGYSVRLCGVSQER